MDVVISVIKIILALAWFLILTLYLTWLERKESAVIQDRIGANRANIWKFRVLGLFQPFADAIKMIFKEDFVPPFANRFLHTLAPFLSFFFVAITICAVPFGDTLRLGGREISLQILDMNAGLLFILAMLSLGIYGIILSGWASRNRFTLLGGIRGAAQLIPSASRASSSSRGTTFWASSPSGACCSNLSGSSSFSLPPWPRPSVFLSICRKGSRRSSDFSPNTAG
jgi:NADH-quinone oxidoreductase subunit H